MELVIVVLTLLSVALAGTFCWGISILFMPPVELFRKTMLVTLAFNALVWAFTVHLLLVVILA